MEYTVVAHVNGRFVVNLKTDSPKEAAEKADYMAQEADFGPLSDIDWSIHAIYDEEGNDCLCESKL